MLAQRLSSINSISALCERTGADIREISQAIGTDNRIGSKFLKSGLGFGGSCFRKDVSSLVYIADTLNLPEVATYWKSVLTMNDFQRRRFSDKILSRLNNTLVRKKITLLGFAYKKDTGDTRESQAVDVIASLLDEAPQEIAIFDPCCPVEAIMKELSHLPGTERVKIYTDPYDASRDASAIAIMTEWDMFRNDTPPMSKRLPSSRSPEEVTSLADASLCTYLPIPKRPCPVDCTECGAGETRGTIDTNQRLDWRRIVSGLKDPKYIFDGRGVLDEQTLAKLGVRVEGLGWGSDTINTERCW
jgi:UDPglucose 6-dehydrogenase